MYDFNPIDPPLHEFLPRVHPDDKVAMSSSEEVITDKFAEEMQMSKEEIINEIHKLQEVNPMLGLRGCRLGITIPELTEMQVRALLEGALNNKRRGLSPRIEIMVLLYFFILIISLLSYHYYRFLLLVLQLNSHIKKN